MNKSRPAAASAEGATQKKPSRKQSPEIKLSHSLSKTLRHAAVSQGIAQDQQGWCKVGDLLAHQIYTQQGATKALIETVVANDNKGRYELSADGERIRAVQGHTANVEVETEELNRKTAPPRIVHGTNRQAWTQISKSPGLHRMKRLHIHMAAGLPNESGVKSGMRKDAEVRIWIDAHRVIDAGIPLLRAKNGAILSPGNEQGYIPSSFFIEVVDKEGKPI